MTTKAEALDTLYHKTYCDRRDGCECGLTKAIAMVQAEARADAEAEVARLRVGAMSWVAYAHGYLTTISGSPHSGDWRDCPAHPCSHASAALAPAATPEDPR